jgi:hypothetical protein
LYTQKQKGAAGSPLSGDLLLLPEKIRPQENGRHVRLSRVERQLGPYSPSPHLEGTGSSIALREFIKRLASWIELHPRIEKERDSNATGTTTNHISADPTDLAAVAEDYLRQSILAENIS